MGLRTMGLGRLVVLLFIFMVLAGCSSQATSPPPAAPSVNVSQPNVSTPVAPANQTPPPLPPSAPQLPYANQPVIRPNTGSEFPVSAPTYLLVESESGYQLNSLTGPSLNLQFEWATDELLVVGQDSPQGGQIVDFQKKLVTVPGTQNLYQLSKGFSADGNRVAFTRGNQLVVLDRRTGQERSWTVAVQFGEGRSIGTDFLSWSPDGRYLLGSWYPLVWDGSGFLTSKLWLLDYESGDLRSITTATGHRANTEPVWSPQGDQVVVRHFHGGYKGAPYPYDYLLIDTKDASSKVIVTCPVGGLLYDFHWDTDGNVVPVPKLPGPNKTRIVGYDPYLNLYENMSTDDGGATYPEVHFTAYDGQIMKCIDLRPVFQEQGITIDETYYVWYRKLFTPDSQYLLLEGQVSKRDDMSQPIDFMCVIPMDTLVPNLTVFSDERANHFIEANYRIHDNKLLVAFESGLAMVDLVTLKQTTLLNDVRIWTAQWKNDYVVYVTNREVGIIHPAGDKQVLLEAAVDDEEFGVAKLSPSSKYLAVQRRRVRDGSGNVPTLEIVFIN